jgi:serine/threonine-protein kinase
MDVIDRTGHCIAARYRLDRMVARGAHTEVWAATDELLHRDVAVKLLDPSVEWLSWSREARAVASVRHENVVAVYDAGESDAGAYLVMELVHGETLASATPCSTASPRCTRAAWCTET